jgi:ribulose-5-phosphate 4-epimerase/fuculose-1-phosphate aldolase
MDTILRDTRNMTDEEWQIRCDLAASFRVHARMGWNEQIGNHHSVMIPGDVPRMVINPRGLLFQELTASKLITCDLDGNVLAGDGELRKVAFHIHCRIHLANPAAACVMHLHPQYLTALSLIEGGRMSLSHHNDLAINDRIAYDDEAQGPAHSNEEGDRLARALGDRSILVMANHGVTVVGPTVHDTFDELFIAERTAMYQLTALSAGGKLRQQPDSLRRHHRGAWGEKYDARLHLDAWRRVLDREEPDYAT